MRRRASRIGFILGAAVLCLVDVAPTFAAGTVLDPTAAVSSCPALAEWRDDRLRQPRRVRTLRRWPYCQSVNSLGWVVGSSDLPGDAETTTSHAFLWTRESGRTFRR